MIPAFLALACAPAALLAQEVVQPLPGTTDADRLAEQMRALAANPRDLVALIHAGELSLSLGDLSGAASLFARAERVGPGNPRVKAGEGSILVRSERPGEALRYFAQAEAAGLDPRIYAADRGLAYDLIGQQDRAQRDYKLALRDGANDEVIKRYALSLGIAGKREAALEQLDPLLRKTDRSAWRMRAFVLAMGGDQAGAEKIAATMLPPGMAQGLQPFFQRLPTLPPADRAFAVHFGEVHTTPERIADARMAPVLPALAPEPQAVALAASPPVPTAARDRRSHGRGRDRQGRVEVAASTQPAPTASLPAARPSVPVTAAQPQPSLAQNRALPATLPQPDRTMASTAASRVPPVPRATPSPSAVGVASTVPNAPAPAATPQPVQSAGAGVVPRPIPSTDASRPVQAPAPSVVASSPTPATLGPAVRSTGASPAPPTPAGSAAATGAPAPSAGAPVAVASTAPMAPTPARTTPAVEVAAAAPVQAAPTPADGTSSYARPPSREEADSVLARIVAGLSIPAVELGVAGPVRPQAAVAMPAPDTAARVVAEAKAKEERDAAAQKALAAKALADKKAADRKAVADRKALAAKKLADDEKRAEAKAAAEEKKAARTNPERIWVQVAAGARESDLPKAWANAKGKAPEVFASRQGWTTPQRATNRVLTGPFKTAAEARAFVNQLAKAGVPAFAVNSEAGQVVTRLPPK